ncbi:hypothetical protein [Amycolatopsis sp. NPDC006125]|uniref:hypothetical protein n=1 Tax=Amycolatopsis sp. NPDC006125 TaxID=3156730 RepID=UPI0033A059E4
MAEALQSGGQTAGHVAALAVGLADSGVTVRAALLERRLVGVGHVGLLVGVEVVCRNSAHWLVAESGGGQQRACVRVGQHGVGAVAFVVGEEHAYGEAGWPGVGVGPSIEGGQSGEGLCCRVGGGVDVV